jgi:hypothetical protein
VLPNADKFVRCAGSDFRKRDGYVVDMIGIGDWLLLVLSNWWQKKPDELALADLTFAAGCVGWIPSAASRGKWFRLRLVFLVGCGL